VVKLFVGAGARENFYRSENLFCFSAFLLFLKIVEESVAWIQHVVKSAPLNSSQMNISPTNLKTVIINLLHLLVGNFDVYEIGRFDEISSGMQNLIM
jgi:hypothetical protein